MVRDAAVESSKTHGDLLMHCTISVLGKHAVTCGRLGVKVINHGHYNRDPQRVDIFIEPPLWFF